MSLDMPFYFFFGILGLVAGGLIVWFLMADHPFESLETPGGPVDEAEVSLLAKEMADDGLYDEMSEDELSEKAWESYPLPCFGLSALSMRTGR